MSAQDIQVVTIVVPNPQYNPSNNAQVVSSSLGYGLQIRSNFVTISPNNPNGYDVIEGLLYVPTLDSSYNTTCQQAYDLIPDNVTTLASFPRQNYPLVALFPWINSTDCVQAYLAQIRTDAARGAVTYQLNANQPSDNPADWWLNGSDAWKAQDQYAAYGIGTAAGSALMQQLALYSGSMSSAPNGQALAQQYDSRDFPRIFIQVDLQGQANVPSLWIFLIIVLAVLLGIVIVASIIMHIIQRHQRRVLQRRVERGEVDLEILGIKKMNVPQEKIEEMPKYVFTEAPDVTVVPVSPKAAPRSSKRISAPPQAPQAPQTSFSQTLCPICLDDFVTGETEVRELPCKHIFHPECIDLFLRDSSSLCPMCKKSAMPAGYCPVKVTNLMVRRERLVRRMRDRRSMGLQAHPALDRSGGSVPIPQTKAQHAWLWIQRRLRLLDGLPSVAAPDRQQLAEMRRRRGSASNSADIEMGPTTVVPEPLVSQAVTQPVEPAPVALNLRRQTMAVPADIAAQGAAARRAWRRERLAQQQEQAYDQQAQAAREVDEGRPLWRRALGRVAPGLD